MKKYLVLAVLLCALVVTPALAQSSQPTIAELQALIAQLMAQIAALTSGSNGCPPGAVYNSQTGALCTTTATTTPPQGSVTVAVQGTPGFSTQYDSTRQEASLTATFITKITNSSPAKILLYQNGGFAIEAASQKNTIGISRLSVNPLVNLETWADAVGNKYWIIPAGRTASFNIVASFNPKIMFAGVYTASLQGVTIPLGDTLGTGTFVQASGNRSNPITVIGEKSPYITSITADPASNLFIGGVRLTQADSLVVSSGAYTKTVPSSSLNRLSDSSITVARSAFDVLQGLATGYYNAYLTSPTGSSNNFRFQVGTAASNPVITSASSKGGSDGEIFAGQLVYVNGTNLQNVGRFGFLSPGEPVYGTVSSVSDNLVTFVAPVTLKLGNYSLYLINTSVDGLGGNTIPVRVTSSNNPGNPSVQLLSPNGGESWSSGGTYRVSWNRTNFNDEVALNLIDYTPGARYGMQYGITNGQTVRTSPGQTSFDWLIPSTIPSGSYYKAVVGMGSVNDFSDNYFTITSPVIPTPAVTWQLTGTPTATVVTQPGGSTTTASYRMTLQVTTNGGVLTRPQLGDFRVIFSSSTDYTRALVAGLDPTASAVIDSIFPSDNSISSGSYSVTISGTLRSPAANGSALPSGNYFMAITSAAATLDGVRSTQTKDWRTPSVYVPGGSQPTNITVSGYLGTSGVSLASSNLSTSCTVDAATSMYYCTIPPGVSTTITPSKAGYTFSPTSRTISNPQYEAQKDFIATPVTFTPTAKTSNVVPSQGTNSAYVNITWNAVSGAERYAIYRCTSAALGAASCGSALTGQIYTNSYNDTGATAGVHYWYAIDTFSTAGQWSGHVLSVRDGWRSAPVVSTCPSPYHVSTSDGRCVWSCGVGTQPNNVTNTCTCQSGLAQTGTDNLGRMVCGAPVTVSQLSQIASALEAIKAALLGLQ